MIPLRAAFLRNVLDGYGPGTMQLPTAPPDPPWVTNWEHNRHLPIFKLPDEVLLNVLKQQLDWSHIRILERVSQRFFYLCSDASLDPGLGSQGLEKETEQHLAGMISRLKHPSQTGKPPSRRTPRCKPARMKSRAMALLEKDRSCRDCRHVTKTLARFSEGCSEAEILGREKNNSWKMLEERSKEMFARLHCKVCKADHPALWFGPGQRKGAGVGALDRRCVGLEGKVKVCAHGYNGRDGWVGYDNIKGAMSPDTSTSGPESTGIKVLCSNIAAHYPSCCGNGALPWAYGLKDGNTGVGIVSTASVGIPGSVSELMGKDVLPHFWSLRRDIIDSMGTGFLLDFPHFEILLMSAWDKYRSESVDSESSFDAMISAPGNLQDETQHVVFETADTTSIGFFDGSVAEASLTSALSTIDSGVVEIPGPYHHVSFRPSSFLIQTPATSNTATRYGEAHPMVPITKLQELL
ncbi:hypothetical protein MKZ38_007920 [Zalerion maritima]|uniref:F-box domain-containing protein n=1 Tax=Zalerion maritima TaxID=339359 RepID=A0AAD5RH73_9PEZI|nr:hypothetical protein MKZ38_007920 [Zalerion maritima]